MVLLAPSLLSSDFARFGATLEYFESAKGDGRPDFIHFDLMDGHFVPNLTFGTGLLLSLRKHTTIPFDVHLMVENAENYIDACKEAEVERVAVHIEASRHLSRLLSQIRQAGMQAGVAVCPATSLDFINWVAEMMDFLIIMGVNPGFSGQTFIPSTIDKVRLARKLLDEKRRKKCTICVDGGVGLDNIATLWHAGARVMVTGNSLFSGKKELTATLSDLRAKATKEPL